MTRWHPPPRPTVPPTVNLTPRQADVLALICIGLSNADIGRRLSIAEDTVKTHVRAILRKLGADSRAHAVAIACGGHVVIDVHEPGEDAA